MIIGLPQLILAVLTHFADHDSWICMQLHKKPELNDYYCKCLSIIILILWTMLVKYVFFWRCIQFTNFLFISSCCPTHLGFRSCRESFSIPSKPCQAAGALKKELAEVNPKAAAKLALGILGPILSLWLSPPLYPSISLSLSVSNFLYIYIDTYVDLYRGSNQFWYSMSCCGFAAMILHPSFWWVSSTAASVARDYMGLSFQPPVWSIVSWSIARPRCPGIRIIKNDFWKVNVVSLPMTESCFWGTTVAPYPSGWEDQHRLVKYIMICTCFCSTWLLTGLHGDLLRWNICGTYRVWTLQCFGIVGQLWSDESDQNRPRRGV